MMNKRILVAADLTNGRDAAFERGLAIARTSGAELYILHAVPANQQFSVGATERLERTSELRDRAERTGVAVQVVEQHGEPAEIIELHANARGVDLIVMGAERHRRPAGSRSETRG
jgi:nucleotide-binding universal stress UspA family protein